MYDLEKSYHTSPRPKDHYAKVWSWLGKTQGEITLQNVDTEE